MSSDQARRAAEAASEALASSFVEVLDQMHAEQAGATGMAEEHRAAAKEFAEQARTAALVAIALALTEPPKSPEPRTVVLGR